jgi:class 3 adenylate cyclase
MNHVLFIILEEWRAVPVDAKATIGTTGESSESLKKLNDLYDSDNAKAKAMTKVIRNLEAELALCDSSLLKLDKASRRLERKWKTGQASADAVGRAVNNGRLFRFLSKPWSAEDLRVTVRQALEAFVRDAELARRAEALERAHRRSLDFVPHEYIRILGRDRLEDVERGDAIAMRLSVFFADVRGFTTLIESMSPAESFDFMNRYFEATEPAIRAHGGFVDHYAGDGTMAIFPTGADAAVRAAIDFARAVDGLNARRAAEGAAALEIGVGVHTGEVIVGVCGGERKLQCGVIGDAVNVAARIEGLTSRYGVRVLVSDDTRAMLTPDAHEVPPSFRELDRVRAKGKREPITIHEVLDALPEARRAPRHETRADFDAGLAAMRQGDAPTALGAFARVVSRDPSDRAAHLHLDACHDLLRGRGSADGVTTLHEKSF